MYISRLNRILISFVIFAVLALWLSPAMADNLLEVDVAKSGAGLIPYDTLYVGGDYELRIWLENDLIYGGLSVAFEIWSPNGATWQYLSQPDGIGMSGYFTIEPGSRIEDAFDMTGVLITEQDVDMIGVDQVMFGGVAMLNGLQPGSLEHMLSLHFRPAGPINDDEIDTICFDTTFFGPSACKFCYIDTHGGAYMFPWDGALCLPVKLLCGNPNGDNDVNVGDAVFMINYVFREGPEPDPWWLGDANCDGTLDVGDIVFLVAAAFRFGPQPECCE
jgi:hypothetical protein